MRDPEIAKLFFKEDPEKLYEDLKEIGHGSFGAVYYARNIHTNESVAIKKMSYSGKQSDEKWQDIIREVQFLTRVNHPNIVEYKGCYLKDHTAWMAMEYCIGSASDLIEVHKIPLQEDEISGIINDAMQGLHYLHQHNKIHRDVKAGNILLTDQGFVKLADFGSASIVSPANSFVGTPYWMSPEVILAMDEGQYDGKADIWSMGITSIELAERKPPLFNMNAMSALYHIAQSDPPRLNDGCWSNEFRNFIHQLLQKKPNDRPNSAQVLKHPFLTRQRSNTVVFDLIMRTKDVVRDLDNLQYRKMKKILIAEHRQQSLQRKVQTSALSSGDHITEDGDENSLDGANSYGSIQSTPSLMSVTSSSKSDSISSLNDSRVCSSSSSLNSQEGLSNTDYESASTAVPSNYHRSASASLSQHPQHQNRNKVLASDGLTRSSSDRMASSQVAPQQRPHVEHIQTRKLTSRNVPSSRNVARSKGGRDSSSEMFNLRDKMSPKKQEINEKLQMSGFATIRSAQVIHRQINQHQEENRHRDQLQGYKKMRREHQKHLISYENKLKGEMDEYSAKLTKELELLLKQFADELERMLKRHKTELHKEEKNSLQDEIKFQKHFEQQQQAYMKNFVAQQAKTLKYTKQDLKDNCKKTKIPNSKEYIEHSLNNLRLEQNNAIQQLQAEQDQTRSLEIRKHKRRSLLERHNLQHNCLREELDLKQIQKKKEHEVLIHQHDSTQNLEYKHLNDIHNLRMERLKSQHQTELVNQTEYSKSQLNEMKRKHAQALRQQPKHLKTKESQIKKQFQETVKIQEKQYKAWRNHVLETVPKKSQKEVLRRKKDEQMRKIALLAEQYENSVLDLNQKQNLKLSDAQEKEKRLLEEGLHNELELLNAFQSRVKIHTEHQQDSERKELEQKVSVRRALLEQRIETELAALDQERSSRIKHLMELQSRNIEQYDQESLNMGFSTVVITNFGEQVYVDPPQRHNDEGYQTAERNRHHANQASSQEGNMPRSSSGMVTSQQQIPYAHRTRHAEHQRNLPNRSVASHLPRMGPSRHSGRHERPNSSASNPMAYSRGNPNSSNNSSSGYRRTPTPNGNQNHYGNSAYRATPELARYREAPQVGNMSYQEEPRHHQVRRKRPEMTSQCIVEQSSVASQHGNQQGGSRQQQGGTSFSSSYH